jgi:release factor glutamine methyltransferase
VKFIDGDNLNGLGEYLNSVEVLVSNPPYIRTTDNDLLDVSNKKSRTVDCP